MPLLQPTGAAPRAASPRRGLKLAQHALAQPLRCHRAAARRPHLALCLELGALSGRGGAAGGGGSRSGDPPRSGRGASVSPGQQASVQASSQGPAGCRWGRGRDSQLRALWGTYPGAGSRDTLGVGPMRPLAAARGTAGAPGLRCKRPPRNFSL